MFAPRHGTGFVMTGHMGGVGTRIFDETGGYVGTIQNNPPGPRFSDAAYVPAADIKRMIASVWFVTSYDGRAQDGGAEHAEAASPRRSGKLAPSIYPLTPPFPHPFPVSLPGGREKNGVGLTGQGE